MNNKNVNTNCTYNRELQYSDVVLQYSIPL